MDSASPPDAQNADAPAPHASIAYNARLGLALFAAYSAVYAGFVYAVAFQPGLVRRTLAGVNYAIWYGMALIVGAILLAILYALLCRTPSAEIEDRG